MIYLFNESKTLFSIVSREELLSFLYEREVNALYQASVEMPVQSMDKNGLTRNLYNEMQNATYFGHYDLNDKFQLHKIVSIDVTGDSFITTAVHLFFDEAKALAVTEERRFIDRPIEDSVIYAFGLIGWTLVEFDVSDAKTVSFFNDTVLEAQAKIIKTFGFKFDYWLDFDGQKITSKKVKVKEELGTQTHQRYVYGHNTLGIKMETDFSEIYTAVLGRGHGERIENLDDEGNETGDTFGRRIEFDEVEWSISSGDPLDKDLGERILVDPVSTQIFGYVREDDTVAPRVKVVEFSDIEDKEELIQASYEWLMENNSPKAVYSVEVLETEELDLGDEVYVVYRDIDFVKSARVSRVVDDLLTERRAVEFGDSDYFRRNSETSRLQRELQNTKNDSADYIQDLKRQANARIDAEMQQARDDFEQALIVVHAEIDAIDENMKTEIANEIAEFENAFNSEVQAAKDLAEQQIADTEQRINTTIDTTRTEMEQDYNQAVQDAREYAEQQAEQHANAVDSKLETMRGVHADLIQQNQSSIANVNDFIGDKTVGLNELLYNERMLFEERINSINTWHYNLLRETQSLDSEFWEAVNGTIETDSNGDSYYRSNVSNTVERTLRSNQGVLFEGGETYTLSFQVQTYGHRSMDYIWIIGDDPLIFDGNYPIHSRADVQTADMIHWGSQYRTYYITFTMRHDVYGFLVIGGNYNNNDLGAREYRIKKPYLTQSDNKQWIHNPEDSLQNLAEVTHRVMLLEDGREEFITRTQYDFETGEIEGTIRNILDTVDGRESIIQNHEDWFLTNGASVLESVDGFQSKAWLSDIHNPNMLSYTDVTLIEHRRNWSGVNTNVTGSAYNEFMRVRNTNSRTTISVDSSDVELVSDVEYTLSWVGYTYGDSVDDTMNYVYVMYPENPNQSVLPSSGTRTVVPTNPGSYGGNTVYKYTRTFTARHTGKAQVRIGGYTASSGIDASFAFKEPKLELGNRATPYYTAFSGLTQRVDDISLLVQEIDGGVLRQSDITVSPSSVRIGSTEILGDDVLSSVLNVSPNAIDMITQKMRLSGDLYVDGDITALAVAAIEGNFASLFASSISTVDLNASNISTGTMSSARLQVNNALINRLIANTILTDEMTARSIDAINGNFARLFASEISTVDLNASNITTGTLSSERLQVNNALINRLISNSILTSEMRAQSLTAVRGDIADLRTRILTSDVITSDHLKVENALIDKMFATSALISRLTSKTAFISQLRTIDLAADQVRVGFNGISNNVTINSSGIIIDRGALTVKRTDGGAPTIIDGVNPSGIALFPATPHRRDSEFTIQGQYAVRDSGSNFLIYDFYMFEWFYSDLMLDFAIYNFENHDIRVRIEITGTDGSTFSKAVDYTIPHTPTRTRFPRMILNLGVPDGSLQRFFIRVRNVGTTSQHGRFGIHTYMVKHLDNGHGYPRLEI